MSSNFLESELIFLKKLDYLDITDAYICWMNDAEVNKFMETRFFPHSRKDIENFIDNISNSNDSLIFGIFDKSTSKHIGNIKLGLINWVHRKANVSLFIGDKDYWGKGYASEAIKSINNYAFDILNLHKLEAGAYVDNIASIKAFEKNGFHIEGQKKQDCFIDNYWSDVILLGKINNN